MINVFINYSELIIIIIFNLLILSYLHKKYNLQNIFKNRIEYDHTAFKIYEICICTHALCSLIIITIMIILGTFSPTTSVKVSESEINLEETDINSLPKGEITFIREGKSTMSEYKFFGDESTFIGMISLKNLSDSFVEYQINIHELEEALEVDNGGEY